MIKFFKNVFNFFTSRLFIIAFLILIQTAILFFTFYEIGNRSIGVYIVFQVISILVTMLILNRDVNPAYKITWIVFVLVVPFAGSLFYVLFSRTRLPKKQQKLMNLIISKNAEILDYHSEDVIEFDDLNHQKIVNYVKNTSGQNPYRNTSVKYYPVGEEFLADLLIELEKAQKFIFIEYYIIQEGKMWDSIYEVLVRKVNLGVEVRLMYDDFGCLRKLPYYFKKRVSKTGIKVVNFNPFRPKLSSFHNYRDHRKITVIDGNVGFTGGINISDEYINVDQKLGHWKDSAVMIKGEGVWGLTSLFLQNWEFSINKTEDYSKFVPTIKEETDGIIQVFGDSPLDRHLIAENTYINVINNAKKYVYITTPYLIIDNELITALRIAAISGVDVRIITPHIPDKKLIFYVTQSYYRDLIKAGVKIFEYSPGFIHAKSLISDDEIALVGTVNLDYRSMYLHMELSCMIIKSTEIKKIALDFNNIFIVSKEITYADIKKMSIFKKIIAFVLKVASPLL